MVAQGIVVFENCLIGCLVLCSDLKLSPSPLPFLCPPNWALRLMDCWIYLAVSYISIMIHFYTPPLPSPPPSLGVSCWNLTSQQVSGLLPCLLCVCGPLFLLWRQSLTQATQGFIWARSVRTGKHIGCHGWDIRCWSVRQPITPGDKEVFTTRKKEVG